MFFSYSTSDHGREALNKGLIKRVGDGSTIRAFEDAWIPTNPNGIPLCKKTGVDVTMVHELIDVDLMCWKEEKLETNFVETAKRAIRQIPLGRFAEDEWAWAYERNGVFCVRSAYRIMASS
jgi:hypothetical protein